MASDGSPGKIPVTSLLQGSQAASSVGIPTTKNGKALPSGGNLAPRAAAAKGSGAVSSQSAASGTIEAPAATVAKAAPAKADASPAIPATDSKSIAKALNKHLNDSGRPDQFRVDPESSNTLIQEINPATGEVIGEFSVDEFPALARSIGATGVLVDTSA